MSGMDRKGSGRGPRSVGKVRGCSGTVPVRKRSGRADPDSSARPVSVGMCASKATTGHKGVAKGPQA